MRGSPSCEITVGRSFGWEIAVAGIAVAALAALLGWLAGSPLGDTAGARIGVALASVGILAAAASVLRHRPVTLRWDGSCWAAAFAPVSVDAATPGELGVALDLGGFLLLTFRPEAGARRSRRRWIPVGRSGLEREWHLFRCAVYSPRPDAGSPAADSRFP